MHLIPHCRPALVDGGAEPEPVYVEMAVQNVHRAVGTTLSHEVTKRFGDKVRAGAGAGCGGARGSRGVLHAAGQAGFAAPPPLLHGCAALP